MSFKLSRVARAKSEIRRKGSLTWGEAAIDIRCRIFLSELEWPWADPELSRSWTPLEEVHATSEYLLSGDNLCNVCQQFSLSEGTHQPDGASLVKSASDGCQLCCMVLESFTANSQENMNILLQHDNAISLKLSTEDQLTVTAGYHGRINHNGESRYFHAPRRLAVLTESNNAMFRGKANTIEFIGDNIRKCLHGHLSCPTAFNQPLPLRLIDVGRPSGDEVNQPYLWINPWNGGALVTDEGQPSGGVYAALSYCWGSVPFLTLTPETLEELQRRIPMEKLPPTLQDAIEITRGLGVRYLWVDALCIFQGKSTEAKDDWSQQSVQMDTIYSQAVVVLGMAASSNAYEGIHCWPYHYRAIAEIRNIQEAMPTDLDDGLRRCFIASQEHRSEDTLGPLYTRGWTFQERILATRFVHLGKDKIFFECDHGRQYEYHEGEPFQFQLCKRLNPHPRFDSWHALVEEYSSRYLTEPTDSLIALSGVAKQFAKRADNPGKYLAGLWEENLVYDLLWCVKSPSVRIDVAPSWSWAARRFEVSYERIHRHVCTPTCATIVGTDVTDFPDLYGFRCSGKILVKGYLRKIFLYGKQERYHIIGFQAPRAQSDSQDTRHRIGICLMDTPNAELSLTRLQSDEMVSWENVFNTWCLQLHLGRGILLQPTGEAVNQFERIGYFEYREQRLPRNTMLREEWASNRNPIAQAAYLVDHPFNWMKAALEAGQDELVEDWFGEPDAIVTLV
ncbi:heterokaryon incompatibility protein-domain-containing protein [Bisporella sp. PMI_857]|nr:heterokaryon incompatibility protein-domain-containing protein [Bisporella sp. PMI_857]